MNFIFEFVISVSGKLRAAVGKAHLLVNQKCQQFRGLCHKNIVSTDLSSVVLTYFSGIFITGAIFEINLFIFHTGTVRFGALPDNSTRPGRILGHDCSAV